MKKTCNKLIFFLTMTFAVNSSAIAQDKEVEKIREVMDKQAQAWNNFDLVGFMDGYWKSDSLKFVSKKGVTYGWQPVLDNYRKSYDSKEKMGVLTFSELIFEKLGEGKKAGSYMVIGKWEVKQAEKTLSGYFTLIFKKIDGNWKIVCDHTS